MLARLGRPRAARVASATPLFHASQPVLAAILFRTVQPTLAPQSLHSSLLPLIRQFHLSRRPQRPITTSAWLEYSKLQEKLRPELLSGQGAREEWAKGWRRQVMLSYAALTSDTTRGDFLFKEVCGITIDWGKVYPAQHPELHAEYCKIQAALESAASEDDIDAIRDAIEADIESTNASLATAFSTLFASSPDNRDILPAYNLHVRNFCLSSGPLIDRLP
ncbi:hypothetical protein JCM5296_005210 [Sporobolomyces johnsonii]